METETVTTEHLTCCGAGKTWKYQICSLNKSHLTFSIVTEQISTVNNKPQLHAALQL